MFCCKKDICIAGSATDCLNKFTISSSILLKIAVTIWELERYPLMINFFQRGNGF